MHFIPSTVPPKKRSTPAYWCVFRGDELLVRLTDGMAKLPFVHELTTIDLKPVRSQYLGTLDSSQCYSAELDSGAHSPEGMEFRNLRELFGHLDEDIFRLSGRAIQIKNWDKNHQYCGRCGTRTEAEEKERVKNCPKCGFKSYPRISPAVITAVLRGKKILLARARRFPIKLYSVIAGFVEPGETLEECVKREIEEEVGIQVKNIRYFGSQPWPFPDSLMIGFTAEHKSGEISIDNTEIVEAGWFSARNLPRVPDKISISRRLIDWYVEKFK